MFLKVEKAVIEEEETPETSFNIERISGGV